VALPVLDAFFFLMPLRRPRSTLFPYTTLFRSKYEPNQESSIRSLLELLDKNKIRYYAAEGTFRGLDYSTKKSITYTAKDKDLVIDRKSTRLNSSHVKISYAVFCLKKNKASQ